ncbi:MAG: hypothetical protein K5660_06300 [Paludibacteraceae bacterium]|nr:hypothetical protein [Paludibacteraceae bacterium]
MRKNLVFFISMLLVLATGCKKDVNEPDNRQNDKDTVAAVRLSETDIRMVQITWDENQKEELPTLHTVTIMPEDGGYSVKAYPEGIVNAKLTGNTLQLTAQNTGITQLTVTDTVTMQSAICKVEVFSVVETLTFPYATVSYQLRNGDWSAYTLVDDAFTYEDENGDIIPLRAYVVDATLSLFSEGFYLKDELFQGTAIGYIISFPATAYYAPEGLNEDRGVSRALSYEAGVWSTAQEGSFHKLTGGWLDKEKESEAIAHVTAAISYTNSDTEEAWNNYYAEMYLADSIAFHGAMMRKYTRVQNGYSVSIMPFALVNAGAVNLVLGGKTPSTDMFEVSEAMMYINPLSGYYGLGVEIAYDTEKGIWYNASNRFLIGKSFKYQYPVPSK